MRIDEIDLSPNAWLCLFRAGIRDVDEIKQMPYGELLKIRNLGSKCAEEVIDKANKFSSSNLIE